MMLYIFTELGPSMSIFGKYYYNSNNNNNNTNHVSDNNINIDNQGYQQGHQQIFLSFDQPPEITYHPR